MYLFVWNDRRMRQFHDNLTVVDYLAVAHGLLNVFRFDKTADTFARLVIDNGRACWVKVPEGDTAMSPEAKLHY